MGNLRVAALQMGPATGSRKEIFKRILNLLEEAAKKEAQIVCFPELALTPYFPAKPLYLQDKEKYFEELPNARIQPLLDLACAYRLGIILPYAEKAGEKFFNSALVINQEGNIIGKYRKVHIPLSYPDSQGRIRNYEDQYFSSGNLGFPIFHLLGVKIGIQICYDRHFPEGFRVLALKGAEIVFLPTNSPTYGQVERKRLWEAILTVRAYENGFFLVASAKAGVEDGIEYIGGSCIVSPKGTFLARATTEDDEVVMAEINTNLVWEARKDLPFLAVRRKEHYLPLCSL